jgi:hypothetical protein
MVCDSGFRISVRATEAEVVISGNPAGLRSSARHLLVLAQEATPNGEHVHLDESNSLADGSIEFILEKK